MKLIEEKKIDAYILQETHLEGDYMKIMNNGFVMIHHGLRQPKNGAKGGVAIIIS